MLHLCRSISADLAKDDLPSHFCNWTHIIGNAGCFLVFLCLLKCTVLEIKKKEVLEVHLCSQQAWLQLWQQEKTPQQKDVLNMLRTCCCCTTNWTVSNSAFHDMSSSHTGKKAEAVQPHKRGQSLITIKHARLWHKILYDYSKFWRSALSFKSSES